MVRASRRCIVRGRTDQVARLFLGRSEPAGAIGGVNRSWTSGGGSAGCVSCSRSSAPVILVTLWQRDSAFISLVCGVVDEEENKDSGKHEPLQADLEDDEKRLGAFQ